MGFTGLPATKVYPPLAGWHFIEREHVGGDRCGHIGGLGTALHWREGGGLMAK